MTDVRRELDVSLDRYEGLAVSEDRERLVALRGAYARWQAVDETVRALSLPGEGEAAYELARSRGGDPNSWETELAGLVERNKQRLAERTAATRASYRASSNVLVGLGVGGMLMACFLGMIVSFRIKRSLAEAASLDTNLVRSSRTGSLPACSSSSAT
jgi:hypothetical protein